jgi:2-polyprenyl-3-methyl-5-hydroxy-6-metoxy-1,4-benzoquinol methylase
MAVFKSTNEYKYANKNKLHQFMLRRFLDAIHQEIMALSPSSILDFGCGEGFFWKAMSDRGMPKECQITGIDKREDALAIAQKSCPEWSFENIDLFDLIPEKANYDLVIAIEVLEHLADPARYLRHLSRLSLKKLILTVPREPWFRLMNFLRGRNLRRWGDHPEHINHWSISSFGYWASEFLYIDRLYGVFPWVVLIGSKKDI